MICIFPCGISGALANTRVGMFALPAYISGIIHNLSAVAFFLLLAYNSLFLFTKSSGEMTEKKKKRNIIFKVCGVGMVLSLAAIFVVRFFGGTWLVEMFALTFFGISWLTKSNSIPFLFAEK
jgi:Na+/H+-translocating membrane pyrophosphatase